LSWLGQGTTAASLPRLPRVSFLLQHSMSIAKHLSSPTTFSIFSISLIITSSSKNKTKFQLLLKKSSAK